MWSDGRWWKLRKENDRRPVDLPQMRITGEDWSYHVLSSLTDLKKRLLCDIYELVRVDEKLWANISREFGGLSYWVPWVSMSEICRWSCGRVDEVAGMSSVVQPFWTFRLPLYSAKTYIVVNTVPKGLWRFPVPRWFKHALKISQILASNREEEDYCIQ